MNLFTGMNHDQIVSFFLVMGVMTVYGVLTIASLAAFYLTSKPRHGRVRTASALYLVALVWFMLAVTTLVWGAPAQKSFFNPGDSARTNNMFIGFGFALVGVLFMVFGAIGAHMQKRALQEQALIHGTAPPA